MRLKRYVPTHRNSAVCEHEGRATALECVTQTNRD